MWKGGILHVCLRDIYILQIRKEKRRQRMASILKRLDILLRTSAIISAVMQVHGGYPYALRSSGSDLRD